MATAPVVDGRHGPRAPPTAGSVFPRDRVLAVMSDPRRDDLSERIDELEETLAALRAEIESPRDRRRPFRPPTPREMLRMADEYAIPAAVAALEANVRALELVQAGIRASDPERAADTTATAVRDGVTGATRATVDRLDRALAEIEASMAGTGMPRNPDARELLTEARRLNDEIADRLAVETGAGRDDGVRIDVESELDSIRDEVSEGTGDGGAARDE